MRLDIQALSDELVTSVLLACADWEELACCGPPFWRPRSSAELRRRVAATAGPQPAAEYSFVLSGDNSKLLGECSIHSIDWRNRFAQVGVCIWNPDMRGKGYGREAVRFVVDWALNYHGLSRLEAWIVEGNEPSIVLFRSFGFEYEGTLRSRYLHRGVRRDIQIWALLADG